VSANIGGTVNGRFLVLAGTGGFTSDFAELQNSLLFTKPKGTTPLLDGVYFGLSELKKAHNPRKILVIISDGGDNNSRYTMRQVLDIAVESDTQIFAIGLYTNPQSPEESGGPATLQRLCSKTGGIAFSTFSPAGLGGVMAKLGEIIHNQYLLGYYPPESQQSGKYRKIKVELAQPSGSPRLNIYARSGYYVR
jgi:Ca-activated chloride channel family protein